MNFFLIYKGHYGQALKGPEMRYVGLAKALNEQEHEVSAAARSFDSSVYSEFLRFIPANNPLQMFKAFMRADCIVLHGGGPFMLLFSLLLSVVGKKIVLDNYVPHWIELDEVIANHGKTVKLSFKSAFNAFRSLMALFTFNMIIVANQRQQDLLRGMIAPFSRTQDFSRIQVIPFGCDPYDERSKVEGIQLLNGLDGSHCLSHDDFLVGWLGGTYGWFDLTEVLASMTEAFRQDSKIKLVFFGVGTVQQKAMLEKLPKDVHENLVFLPWVPFQERFSYWAAFDVSLVWGGAGYENDYASRTRNFDCLSLGLPVIQNEDDEWGSRLKSSGSGVVTSIDRLSKDIVRVSQDGTGLQKMRMAMIELAPDFYWGRFAERLTSTVNRSKMSFLRRLIGVIALICVLPAIILFFLFSLVNRI